MFEHRLFPENDLTSITMEDGRFYRPLGGPWFPSVTTVLGKMQDKSWHKRWLAKIGNEKAQAITERACRRGTSMHNLCEKYIRNDSSWKDENPFDLALFRKVQGTLDRSVGPVYGIEVPLYSYDLRLAGRADLLALWENDYAIIDYKTSLAVRSEKLIHNYLLQATLYSIMAGALFSINIPRIVLVIMVDADQPQIVIRDARDYEQEAVALVRKYHQEFVDL